MSSSGGEALPWRNAEGFRVSELSVPAGGRVGFTHIPAGAAGVTFTNLLNSDKLLNNHNLLNGAGVAAGDYDDDGRVDLFFCGVAGRSSLFRNLGNWQFEDATDRAGVACFGQASTGAAFVDADGDGLLDLFVTSCGGPNAYFKNLGSGRFTNLTESVGFAAKTGSTSMSFADVDGDGDLDIYVANYGENTIRSGMPFSTRMVGGKEVVTGRNANRLRIINGRIIEFGEPDFFGLNDGTGKFTAVPFTGGAFADHTGQRLKQAPWDLGLSAMFRDINGDMAPDLYVCNDFQTPDRVWLNDGRARFNPLRSDALPYTSWFSMAVDFADVNRDGLVDFFVADMDQRFRADRLRKMPSDFSPPIDGEWEARPQYRQNTLALNRGDGTFAEIAQLANLAASEWTWSAAFIDVDLNGFEDLLIGNGHAYDTEDQDTSDHFDSLKQTRAQTKTNLLAYPRLTPPNMAFRNNGDLTFNEVGASWGFNSTNVSHGMCLADLDNDGDQDVVLNAFQAAPLMYRNDASGQRIAVRLRGSGKNTRGIGARIEVKAATLNQSQEMIAGGRYLSSDDPLRSFAFFEGAAIEVTWRSGKGSVVKDVRPNRIYEVNEQGAVAIDLEKAVQRGQPLFTAFQSAVAHSAPATDDFSAQTFLAEPISRHGPAVVATDWDRDGKVDLIVGGNTRAAPQVLSGASLAAQPLASNLRLKGDAGSILVLTNDSPVLVVADVDRVLLVSRDKTAEVPLIGMIAGAVAAGDVDGDGDADLFVAARPAHGKWPACGGSKILQNDGGEFKHASRFDELFSNIGLVSDARFADVNGDGAEDLIVASNWGPVRVFVNEAGKFADATARLGLEKLSGCWNGLAIGDFDRDGKLDFVASNLGRNHRWQRYRPAPARVYYGDFDGNEAIDIVEALVEDGRPGPMAVMARLGKAVPGLAQRFKSARQFSEANINDVLGESAASARWLEATWFESAVFLNRGDRFEAHALPMVAQFAPGFGLAVADFNADGAPDIFMSQNLSGLSPDYSPMVSGRGALMFGDGKGAFTALSSVESGISISGDQRGCVAGDFDGDGWIDLAVGVHGGPLKIFHNASQERKGR